MAKKRNRCRVKSCSVVISEDYHFCYMHRKWSLHDVRQEQREYKAIKREMKRFFCDPCGTVYHAYEASSCRACGAALEEIPFQKQEQPVC